MVRIELIHLIQTILGGKYLGTKVLNILLQQSDLVIVFGSRLGLQQAGFNHEQFVPVGKVCQIDIDNNELTKGHLR